MEEFRSLSYNPKSDSRSISEKKSNTDCIRYKNIEIYSSKSRISFPGWGLYDKNLFRFSTDAGDIFEKSDIGPEQFINASYVDMEISKNQIDQYILTQGLVRL